MADKILFIDRDGTLIREPDDYQVDALAKVDLVDGVIPALRTFIEHGFRLVIVSNQDGLGTDAFPQDDYQECHDFMLRIFGSQGIHFDEIFVCPHLPDAGCECRKPRTGLLTKFLAANDIDLGRSAVIGDRDTDIELARRIGVRGFQLNDSGSADSNWGGIVAALCFADREATVTRKTNETDIVLRVNLDAPGSISVTTGIGFFDHMLEQIAKHAGFSLALDCNGDLSVDEHHTVEDVAICLGAALRDALGNKMGIGRYGFVVPMDEAEARASIDLSGRGVLEFAAEFPRDAVGELSVEMVEHFFLSFSDALGAALHIRVTGRNTHHMVEACFKALGRCLRQAIRIEDAELPSTKGVLA